MSQTIYMEQEDTPLQDSEDILKKIENLPTAEEKLKAGVESMRQFLAQDKAPNFKGFWDVRKACLPLFKEPVTPSVRTQLWDDFIELTREGRKLKSLLDEESAFAIEQIELAVTGLEDELKGYQTHLNEILEKSPDIEFPEESQTLSSHYDFYQGVQKQLNLLNLYASRINALRKELIRTQMRIGQKNRFFQKLSLLGDEVFPLRKELIQNLSQAFIEDVTAFVDHYFSEQNFRESEMRHSVFMVRKEIKTLQSVAKILTLNTHAFSTTRELLSDCWDKLKGMEKELKKEYAEQKQKSAENVELVKQKIDDFVALSKEGNLSYEEGMREIEKIAYFMRDIELTRYDVRMLKEMLHEARAPMESKREEEMEAKRQKEAQFEKARQEKLAAYNSLVASLQSKIALGQVESLTQELEEAKKALPHLSITKNERQQFERTLKTIRDQIADKQGQALLSLSDADRAALDDLENLQEELMRRRKEIKSQVEDLRKTLGGSNLDFESSLRYMEQMETEKESLAKLDENINEINKKILGLKKTKG